MVPTPCFLKFSGVVGAKRTTPVFSKTGDRAVQAAQDGNIKLAVAIEVAIDHECSHGGVTEARLIGAIAIALENAEARLTLRGRSRRAQPQPRSILPSPSKSSATTELGLYDV